jgi:putative PIN family toxin of toxin-antitoxin system
VRSVVVFDTNILFSAQGWRGAPYQCVQLARSGIIEGVTCQELLDELSDKLQTKLNFTADEALETVAELLTFLRVVQISGQLKVVAADPDDDKAIECAVVGGATHLVTGDRRHLLPMGAYQTIQIVTATQFIAAVASP